MKDNSHLAVSDTAILKDYCIKHETPRSALVTGFFGTKKCDTVFVMPFQFEVGKITYPANSVVVVEPKGTKVFKDASRIQFVDEEDHQGQSQHQTPRG